MSAEVTRKPGAILTKNQDSTFLHDLNDSGMNHVAPHMFTGTVNPAVAAHSHKL